MEKFLKKFERYIVIGLLAMMALRQKSQSRISTARDVRHSDKAVGALTFATVFHKRSWRDEEAHLREGRSG